MPKIELYSVILQQRTHLEPTPAYGLLRDGPSKDHHRRLRTPDHISVYINYNKPTINPLIGPFRINLRLTLIIVALRADAGIIDAFLLVRRKVPPSSLFVFRSIRGFKIWSIFFSVDTSNFCPVKQTRRHSPRVRIFLSEQLVKILTRPRRSIKQAKRTRTRVRITLGKIEFFFFRNSKSPVQCKRNRSPRRGSTVRVYKLSGSSAVHYRTVLFFGVHPPPPFKYTDMYGRDPAETGGKTPISTRVVIITVVGTRTDASLSRSRRPRAFCFFFSNS